MQLKLSIIHVGCTWQELTIYVETFDQETLDFDLVKDFGKISGWSKISGTIYTE